MPLIEKSAIIDDNDPKEGEEEEEIYLNWLHASKTPPFHKYNLLSTENHYDLSTQSNEMVLGPSNSYGLHHRHHIDSNILYHIPKRLSNSMYTIYKSFDSVMVHILLTCHYFLDKRCLIHHFHGAGLA